MLKVVRRWNPNKNLRLGLIAGVSCWRAHTVTLQHVIWTRRLIALGSDDVVILNLRQISTVLAGQYVTLCY